MKKIILPFIILSFCGCRDTTKPVDSPSFDSMMVRRIMAKGWPRDRITFGNVYSQGLNLPLLWVDQNTAYVIDFDDSIPPPKTQPQ